MLALSLSTLALLLLSSPVATALWPGDGDLFGDSAAETVLFSAPGAADVRPPPPPPPALAFSFDAAFGSNMVLQQGPSHAAVYGYVDAAATAVSVSLLDSQGAVVASVSAAFNATQQPFGADWGARPCPKAACPPYDMNPFTPFGVPLPTWKALLPPMPSGGNYSLVATCTGCSPASPSSLSLVNVTFGMVWYCTGQSNMWLPVQNTFTRNATAATIAAGGLSNVRAMVGSAGHIPYAHFPPQYGNQGGSNPWLTAEQAAPAGCVEKQSCPLFTMGSTCWYFAQSLAEQGITVPIGIIDTAIGGQRIEEFMSNATILTCSQRLGENIPWWNAQLYGQQVLPFVDLTIEGWVWYQGENNMGGVKGNELGDVGYGCMQRELVKMWRKTWSATPGTTHPQAPFGLVTLASSGSEGGPNMGTMRWAQTTNYGVLPSPALPNAFIAQAYDLDDPWGPASGPCFSPWQCCGSKRNATACAGRESQCAVACAADADTPSMGGIHPRDKYPVGQRLGRAAYNLLYGGKGAFTGPTLSSCKVQGSDKLVIQFNTDLLRGEHLVLQQIPPYLPSSRSGGSQLWVQTNASLFCMEPQCVLNATSSQCLKPPREYCPTWAGGDGLTLYPPGVLDQSWTQLNFTADETGSGLVVDLSPLAGASPTAVRYAWGIIDCCDHTDPTLYITHGCVAACPIMSSGGLPANPFQARIVDGACSCVEPQVCS